MQQLGTLIAARVLHQRASWGQALGTHSHRSIKHPWGHIILPAPGYLTSARLGSSPRNVLALALQSPGSTPGQSLLLCAGDGGDPAVLLALKSPRRGLGAVLHGLLTPCGASRQLCDPRKAYREMFLKTRRSLTGFRLSRLSLELTYTPMKHKWIRKCG